MDANKTRKKFIEEYKRIERYALPDKSWAQIQPFIVKEKLSTADGVPRDTRMFVNAVFWVLRTGKPWEELLFIYGAWQEVFSFFLSWSRKGLWTELLAAIVREPQFTWLLNPDRGNDSNLTLENVLPRIRSMCACGAAPEQGNG